MSRDPNLSLAVEISRKTSRFLYIKIIDCNVKKYKYIFLLVLSETQCKYVPFLFMNFSLGSAKNVIIGFFLFQLKGTRKEKKERKKKFIRMAAGQTWEDPTLAEWDTGMGYKWRFDHNKYWQLLELDC